MKYKKIMFHGFMAAVLFGAGANAAEIASKSYVDAQDTATITSITNSVSTTLQNYVTTADVNDIVADVDDKADKVNSATAGNLAGLDADGNLTDSGVSGSAVSTMQTNVTTLQGSVANLETNVGNLQTTVAGKADSSALTSGLAGKANLQNAGAAGFVATVDATGQYIRSGIAESDIATTANVTSIVNGAISTAVEGINGDIEDMLTQTEAATTYETQAHASATYETQANVTAGLALKEDKANKASSITSTEGSEINKYPTVGAVVNYSIPKPSAACMASQLCVLAITPSGEVSWETVVMAAP